MFREHGSFGQLEVQVSKKSLKADRMKVDGGWYTRAYLENVAGWTKRLIVNILSSCKRFPSYIYTVYLCIYH